MLQLGAAPDAVAVVANGGRDGQVDLSTWPERSTASGCTRSALRITRAANVGTLIGSCPARMTSGSLYRCCWKLW